MDMQNREKAQMVPVVDQPEEAAAVEQVIDEAPETEENETWVEHLAMIRSYQKTNHDEFRFVSKALQESKEAQKALLTKLNAAIVTLHTDEQNFIQSVSKQLTEQTKAMKDNLATKEREITQALNEVKNLKMELLKGFMNLNTQNKVPLKHQLYKLSTLSLCSVLGGLITFLVLTRFWP